MTDISIHDKLPEGAIITTSPGKRPEGPDVDKTLSRAATIKELMFAAAALVAMWTGLVVKLAIYDHLAGERPAQFAKIDTRLETVERGQGDIKVLIATIDTRNEERYRALCTLYQNEREDRKDKK